MRPRRIAAALGAAALAALACAVHGQAGPGGYLAPGTFNILAVLPPAPNAGDSRDAADRAIFRQTRALRDTPRWTMATRDVQIDSANLMQDFSCAMGVTLSPADAPRTIALVNRAFVDLASAAGTAKDYYHRRRPYLVDQGATCQPPEQLDNSPDYPSGHATLGWAWGTLLAWEAPDRSTGLLARARAYGESRVVCGVHNLTAVEAGRVTATAVLDAMAGTPSFQSDLAAARAEMDGLRRRGSRPDQRACAFEAQLVAQRVF